MFESVSLREVAADRGLVGGPFGSSLTGKDYTESGVPVIRGGNMGPGTSVSGEFAFVSVEKYENELSRNSAVPGDLVFTQRGTLGQVAIVPETPYPVYVVSQSQMRLRVDKSRYDRRFVLYACATSHFEQQIRDNAIATGVPHINLGILTRLTIPSPPLLEQRAIAEVLGALDDKIAANTRQAHTLLALADAEFSRRGHGLPWSEKSFSDVASVCGGGTPSTKVDEYWGGEISWATPTDVTGLQAPFLHATARTITQAGLDACASRLYPTGSILMTSRATIGAFALAEVPVAVNQGFIVVNAAEPALQPWLFHEMRARFQEFVAHANGATFLELSRGRFKALPVRLADHATVSDFSAVASALHAKGAAVMRENASLAKSRDALLPLLMSGRVRVKDAETTVEGVV